MRFYYQHVGEAMAARDFPRSLGTPEDGVHQMKWEDLDKVFGLSRLVPIADRARLSAEGPYQVWGLPAGAAAITRDMAPGDTLMLMSSRVFEYIGEVAYVVPSLSAEVSTDIWGEGRFPLLVLLREGRFIELSFEKFRDRLGFAPNYHMRGNTMVAGETALRRGGFADADALRQWAIKQGEI